jgi:hypothetical protein
LGRCAGSSTGHETNPALRAPWLSSIVVKAGESMTALTVKHVSPAGKANFVCAPVRAPVRPRVGSNPRRLRFVAARRAPPRLHDGNDPCGGG